MTTDPTKYEVRLAVLEEQFSHLIDKIEEREKRSIERDKKLDALLALKDQGMGAIWLATLIFGSSLVAGLSMFVNWLKG